MPRRTEIIEDAVIEEPGEEMAVYEHTLPAPTPTLFGTDDPVQVIERASAVATALKDVIEKQKLTATISGRQHVLVEGWTVLGSMLGIFPVLESCEPVTVAGVDGFKAVVAAQTMNGNVIGRASGYCMKNESRWCSADIYAVASMAQTRATSKAMRIPLGFIMQIAGYETTPAEERGAGGDPTATATIDTELLAALINAIDANNDALELWEVEVVLANASRKFGRQIKKLRDLSPEEAEQIREGAIAWRKANPRVDDGIEFAPEMPNVSEMEDQ